ncbi:hypothetical protein NPS53_08850 [Pseudomonas putida]|uniref:hypothetical protein n=1 Tax=Pseudomonas putida TaxID=303 RepID=UPI0023634159|nr:hypothetical protein [Pseudomonas putida]MDD2139682.1 hypothetical protein [Pseudomonas putida]HDS1721606.1 hypothetical protein [Pseudomonas putida]
MKSEEILRSSFTQDGIRFFLVFDAEKTTFRIGTRWHWLESFDSVWDACDAFEAMELADGDHIKLGRLIKKEISRVPRIRFVQRGGMGRINYLINSIERRLQGLRPQRCGSKGAVERWIPAN